MAVVWRMVCGVTVLAAMDGALVFGCGSVFADDMPDTESCDGCAVGVEE